jgi:aminoglycoside phosphotransferase (APT) family kinase protein
MPYLADLSDPVISRIVEHVGREHDLDVATEPIPVLSSRTATICKLPAPTGHYALKIRASTCFARDVFFYDRLHAHGIPSPRLYADGVHEGRPFLLYEWIDGHPTPDPHALGCAIGRTLARLHQIEVDGAGDWSAGAWSASSWADFIAANIETNFIGVLAASSESSEFRKRLTDALHTLVETCRVASPPMRLLHADVHPDNVIWTPAGQLFLIDPGWCLGGDTLLDISYMLLHPDAELLAGFRMGYGGFAELDQLRLQQYAVYHRAAKFLHFRAVGEHKAAQHRARILPLLGLADRELP